MKPTEDSDHNTNLRRQFKSMDFEDGDELDTKPQPLAENLEDWASKGITLPSKAVDFSKHIHSSLATGNATALAEHLRPTFDDLNQDGTLADTLNILYDMRLMELQNSVRHARKMREIIDILAE